MASGLQQGKLSGAVCHVSRLVILCRFSTSGAEDRVGIDLGVFGYVAGLGLKKPFIVSGIRFFLGEIANLRMASEINTPETFHGGIGVLARVSGNFTVGVFVRSEDLVRERAFKRGLLVNAG